VTVHLSGEDTNSTGEKSTRYEQINLTHTMQNNWWRSIDLAIIQSSSHSKKIFQLTENSALKIRCTAHLIQ